MPLKNTGQFLENRMFSYLWFSNDQIQVSNPGLSSSSVWFLKALEMWFPGFTWLSLVIDFDHLVEVQPVYSDTMIPYFPDSQGAFQFLVFKNVKLNSGHLNPLSHNVVGGLGRSKHM